MCRILQGQEISNASYVSTTLFERTLGGLKIPESQSIAENVARECGGLPILLVTVASALKNKDINIWKDALNRLSTSKGEQYKSCLQLSYDHLPDDEVESFFLLCGLFTSFDIGIIDLLKYSMGLGLLKGVRKVEAARLRVHKLIEELKGSCLLSESETHGCVRMHDVVQDAAASIASKSQFRFKVGGASLEEFQGMDTKSCTKVCLDICDVSMACLKSKCPTVEFFRLYGGDRSSNIPDSFFEGITKLQVLDLSKTRFSSLPSSLGSLASVLSRRSLLENNLFLNRQD